MRLWPAAHCFFVQDRCKNVCPPGGKTKFCSIFGVNELLPQKHVCCTNFCRKSAFLARTFAARTRFLHERLPRHFWTRKCIARTFAARTRFLLELLPHKLFSCTNLYRKWNGVRPWKIQAKSNAILQKSMQSKQNASNEPMQLQRPPCEAQNDWHKLGGLRMVKFFNTVANSCEYTTKFESWLDQHMLTQTLPRRLSRDSACHSRIVWMHFMAKMVQSLWPGTTRIKNTLRFSLKIVEKWKSLHVRLYMYVTVSMMD